MGSTVSQFNDSIKINFDQWDQVSRTPTMIIMKNKKTLEEAQLHNVILKQTQNFNEQMRIYLKRKNIQEAIVKVYGVKVQQSNTSFICKERVFLKVLTQKMSLKFTEIPKLSFSQILYLLIESLKAFKMIYKQTGMFQINRNMIGINNKKQVKVWANQNFAINHPNGYTSIPQTLDSQEIFSRQQYRNIFIKATKNEKKMITRIVQLIQTKYQLQNYPKDFYTILNSHSNSFDQILKAIVKYQSQKNIEIPKKLQINLQKIEENIKIDAVPMKSFKRLRKNQNKQQKAVFRKRQNKHSYESNYLTQTLPLKQNQKNQENIDNKEISNINKIKPIYFLNHKNQNQSNLTLRQHKYSLLQSQKKCSNNRRCSTSNQAKTKRKQYSQSKALSPSFLKNKNKELKQCQNNSKRKSSNKKSVSKDKIQYYRKLGMFNAVTYRSPIRNSINSPIVSKNINDVKTLRYTWNKQKTNQVNNEQSLQKNYFIFSKNQSKQQNHEKRSLSHDIMRLKIALHLKSK